MNVYLSKQAEFKLQRILDYLRSGMLRYEMISSKNSMPNSIKLLSILKAVQNQKVLMDYTNVSFQSKQLFTIG